MLSLLVVVCCGPPCAFAQKTGKDVGAIFKSWDRNGDGLLQKSEIPESARAKMQDSAKRRGLDAKKPIHIKTYLRKSNKKSAVGDKGDSKSKKRRSESENKLALSDAAKKKSSKGFGKRRSVKKAAGFRTPGQLNASKSSGANEEESKARRNLKPLAKSMMIQHDKNKNGRLEKSEWARLKGNPGASDRNKDGELTMSELTDHLADYGSREKDVRVRSNRTKSKRSSAKKGDSSDKKSYRFLTPHERLPNGLPGWFVDNDKNGDGQLSLKEYASRLTPAKVDKFMQLDLNKDGLLVAKEYLKATE
jgi:Ca2+-binding EF-hand superfamily protein